MKNVKNAIENRTDMTNNDNIISFGFGPKRSTNNAWKKRKKRRDNSNVVKTRTSPRRIILFFRFKLNTKFRDFFFLLLTTLEKFYARHYDSD